MKYLIKRLFHDLFKRVDIRMGINRMLIVIFQSVITGDSIFFFHLYLLLS